MTERAARHIEWAIEMFGDIALNPRERALRFAEEALELAQTIGVDPAQLHAIIDRVYARPPGDTLREVGQCVVTLESFAHVARIDADAEAEREYARVQSIPKDEWQRRHRAKQAQGIIASHNETPHSGAAAPAQRGAP